MSLAAPAVDVGAEEGLGSDSDDDFEPWVNSFPFEASASAEGLLPTPPEPRSSSALREARLMAVEDVLSFAQQFKLVRTRIMQESVATRAAVVLALQEVLQHDFCLQGCVRCAVGIFVQCRSISYAAGEANSMGCDGSQRADAGGCPWQAWQAQDSQVKDSCALRCSACYTISFELHAHRLLTVETVLLMSLCLAQAAVSSAPRTPAASADSPQACHSHNGKAMKR
jgi:hypothetical protein